MPRRAPFVLNALPLSLAALTGCAHIDRQGTFDGLVKDRIGFDYAADLPESLPVEAQTHWLRARTCTGPDDPGPRAVALAKSGARIPRVFWLPCRDDGQSIEAFARARGLEFKARDERDATRPGAAAPIREQTLGYPGQPPGESVAVFAVGEGDETIVIAGSYFDLAPEEMPAVNALYAMGRALYPEPSRRDAVRTQWRADARRRGREAWLRRHREGAMAAFAQGHYATALAHLTAERQMWTRSAHPDARPWPPGAALPASFGLDTPLATAIAIVAARLEAQGFVMRVATRLDDRLGEALSKQLRARLPWVTFVPSAAPQGPNVLVVDVDWAGVRVDAYTRQYERQVWHTVHDTAAEASLDAARGAERAQTRAEIEGRIAEIGAALESVEQRLRSLPGPSTTYTRPERQGVGPQARVQDCRRLPGGGEECTWKDQGLFEMTGGVKTVDESAADREALAHHRERLQLARRELEAALRDGGAPKPAEVTRSTYTLEPTTETGSEVWGDAKWSYTLRAGRGTPGAERGTVEFLRTLADTSPTFVERTLLVPTLFEKIWDDHLRKALDSAFVQTCFDRPQRVLTRPEWTEWELQSGKLCGLNPSETAWQALDLEPPEAFRPTDEERAAWEAAETGAAQIAAAVVPAAVVPAAPARTLTSPEPPDDLAKPRDWQVTDSMIFYRLERAAGDAPRIGHDDTVELHMKGWSTAGATFDDTWARGAPLTLRPADAVPGFAEALRLMGPGDTGVFWIPPALAYGDAPPSGIPAGTLVYRIDVLRVVKP